MAGPLTGLVVVDCSVGMAGPRATGMLADYGADVIWVEPPGGDPLREHNPAAASVFNRGKLSVVVRGPEDPALSRLLDAADVFVESWAPGMAERFGLGCDAVHDRNPALVYCSISGFGADGPHRDVPGHEALVFALLGTMGDQAGHREGPIFQGLPFASIGASYLALIGILGALLRRGSDGAGRRVETSLFDGALAYHSMMWGESDQSVAAMATLTEPAPRAMTGTATIRLITRSFQCADDEFIGIHTGAQGAFGRFMEVVGLADRIPPSETGMDIGMPLTPEQRDIIERELPKIFMSKPRQYWVDRFLDADVCAVEHLRPCEVFDQEQARHNRMVVTVDDPVLGVVEQVGLMAKFPSMPGQVDGPAPMVGAHTEAVLGRPPVRASVPGGGAPDRRPLFDGIKVLDLGAYYAGPYSSRLLADLGADVIKLEPTQGDQLRGIERPFYSAQAGKRSIAANIKDPAFRPAVEGLLRWADVVHHNLRPGAAERLGLDYESVRAVNPEIVYLYAPGWGSTGPQRLRQSFAPMMSGFVGVTYEVAGAFNEPMPPVGNEDPGNGLLGAVGILMALLVRQRTGRGQYVENPQLNATMGHMAHVVRRADGTVVGAGRLDTLQYGNAAVERLYETADGWVCVVAYDDQEVGALGTVLGLDLAGDDRFATAAARREHDHELAITLSDVINGWKTAALVAALQRAGVPAVEPIEQGANHRLVNDAEQRRIGRIAEMHHPVKGNVREVAVLVRVSDADVPPHRLAPELGEHTDDILRWLGVSDGDIAALRERGAVR